MSLYINTLVADAHRMQLIREAEAFRRGREARKWAAVARKAHRRGPSVAVAKPVAVAEPGGAAVPAAAAAGSPAGQVVGVYCRRAAAFAACTSSPVSGAC